MFRPYKVILRPSKKTDPRVVYEQLLGLIRPKHVALTKYTVFVHK